jgi:hypothetical protein
MWSKVLRKILAHDNYWYELIFAGKITRIQLVVAALQAVPNGDNRIQHSANYSLKSVK